jgi:RNA polymerase sigma-70 factor (ECF subfamily)
MRRISDANWQLISVSQKAEEHGMDYEIGLKRQSVKEESADLDAEMAEEIASGDTGAWDRFFDRFSPWTYRFAYHHLAGNHADAQDLCSDILITAARSIGKYDATRGSLDVWLLGIARHRLSRFCRHRRIEQPLTADLQSCDADRNPDREERMVMRSVVNRILADLPERQSYVLTGKYVEGYSTNELARMMDTTPKAVESLLVRAKNAFRKALSAITGGENDG